MNESDRRLNSPAPEPSLSLGDPPMTQINHAGAGSTINAVQNGDQIINNSYLGITRPDIWLEADEYLHRMHRGAIYTHRWQLVGRAAIMDSLLSFAQDGQGGVSLLTGRGGVGKTKILTSLCEALSDAKAPVAVHLLDQSSDIGLEAFGELPRTGRLLVIIDDAHNQTLPLGKIIAGVWGANGSANILLSLRPYGVAHVRRELARAGMHASEATEVEIGDLDFEDATALACEVLDEASRGYAARLAAAARDCPLLIVTGAALINNGSLDPQGFEGNEQLHTELTDRLADALTTDSTSEVVRQDLLCALAAFQPVRLAEPDARTSLEAITGLPFDLITSHLSALEESGVLLRHGDAVRVVPDLLGDALLVRAARHRSSGLPTGYLVRAMKAARGSALHHLLINAGRVDWQEHPAGAGKLIEPLWAQLTTEFQATDAYGRIALLKILAKVSFFQPRRALDLASWTMDNPCEPVTTDIGFGMMHTYTDTDVRHGLPSVLLAIAYHPNFLPKAAGLLWELGGDDLRSTNQHPEHPLRILAEFAAFTRLGSTDYQRILLAQVERWLARATDQPTPHAPLAVLSPLLATEGHDEQWTPDALTLTFRPYVLLPTPEVLELRGTVLDLAFTELGHSQLARASAAASLIGAALTLPRGGFGLNVTAEMWEPWILHFVSILARLHRYVVEQTLAPAVLVAIRSELQWLAQYGPEDLLRSANSVLAAIPKDPDNELARALHGGPTDPTASSGLPDWHGAQQALFSRVATALTPWSDERIAIRIEALLGEEQSVFGEDTGRARPFAWELVTQRPSVGEALCERALSNPAGALVPLISITLIAMARAAGDHAIHWGRLLAASGSVQLAREVAHAFGIQRGRTELLEDEPDLLRELAANEDRIVRAAALGAVRTIAGQHKAFAIELITTSLHDEASLSEIALAFSGPPLGSLSWSDLSTGQREAFLTRLTECDSLDSYEIAQFLAQLTLTEPGAVVRLLEARVEVCEKSRASGYSPLPFSWQVAPSFREHADFSELLRQILEWLAAAPDSVWRQYLGADVFALVAGPYDEPVAHAIDEYLTASDQAKMKVIAIILRKAPRELVWNPDFVRRYLRMADQYGDQTLYAIQSSLHSAVVTGARWGTPGNPYPQDMEQYEKATELADSCAIGSVEEQFYRSFRESVQHSIQLATHDLPPDNRAW
ncbi:ATP-binding protein [Kitasatospora aureofaciens]|uniref:ATP-binding protein n=1 Tax=Kitasatospora aureofaciens TaxID=1894 RepID=UPI000AAEBCAC|nr:ATP-binding protein [Kitasatospora aureofaciens]